MIIQFHHQFRDGKTEMQRQQNIETRQELKKALKEVNEKFPLPKNAIWMWCEIGSPYFVGCAK